MIQELTKKLGYQFKKTSLLEMALTHRSMGGASYERLEFLGDAVLDFLVADELYRRFPEASEGLLSRMRAALVNRDILVEMAQTCDVGEYVKLGQGEMSSGGKSRPSILADAMEAIICAIYLDTGLEACRERILVWLDARLSDPVLLDQNKDAKSTLQEWTQANQQALPVYTVKKMSGDDHTQVFEVTCHVSKLKWVTEGKGSNRRSAEQMAAQAYLDQLECRKR